jgi:hypothetical protein
MRRELHRPISVAVLALGAVLVCYGAWLVFPPAASALGGC